MKLLVWLYPSIKAAAKGSALVIMIFLSGIQNTVLHTHFLF